MRLKASFTLYCSVIACAAALSACVVEPARPPRPEPVVEVMPAAPAPGYHWVKGHYHWEGDRWVWMRGHWAAS
jgi:WXXGXW repeat (2 copies)